MNVKIQCNHCGKHVDSELDLRIKANVSLMTSKLSSVLKNFKDLDRTLACLRPLIEKISALELKVKKLEGMR